MSGFGNAQDQRTGMNPATAPISAVKNQETRYR